MLEECCDLNARAGGGGAWKKRKKEEEEEEEENGCEGYYSW